MRMLDIGVSMGADTTVSGQPRACLFFLTSKELVAYM